ncbi:MAG: hypothetical protein K8F92_08730 [Hyphomicrobium sp.]|uniref:hypothetical protein n=1 Tax=Hyphomicrobium sp. TaxID=82 RepID=UPI001326941D|nr:hypothetical protein [Hyphomicrobium sp.]KAB2943553.1 MAG: hypothetical protein F9K20_02445 [Hyphomicrobium sp.]MBZ0209727.1 hypothetical protein [Hyphomicrobium sp.]
MFKPLVVAAALAAVAMAGAVNQATANTVWVYPYKGTPYAVPHDHGKQADTLKTNKKAAREKARDRFSASGAIVIAHHKPGYHDGLPRTPRSEEPEDLLRSTA